MKTKTEEEFKLDEKIQDGLGWLGEPADFLLIEDVKQFIKELKEFIKKRTYKKATGEIIRFMPFEFEDFLKQKSGEELLK